MRDPTLALQGALHALLSSSLTVYDAVPQNAAFPYVTVGDDTMTDWSAKGEGKAEVTATVHTWSRYKGRKECKEIMDDVLQAVTGASWSLTGFHVVTCGLEFSQVLEEADGITRHGVQRFRFRIEEV